MKHSKRKLGLLLAVMMLMQLVLPAVALAEDPEPDLANRTGLIFIDPDKVIIKQGGQIIDTDHPATSTQDISVELSFKVPVKDDYPAPEEYIKTNDYIDINLGKAFKLATGQSVSVPLKAGGEDVGTVGFTTNLQGEVIAKVTFTENSVFGEVIGKSNVTAGFSLNLSFDAEGNPELTDTEIVGILGKSFSLNVADRLPQVKLDKTGKVNWATGQIEWEVKVEKASGEEEISLANYVFTDVLNDATTGPYVGSSFEAVVADEAPSADGTFAGDGNPLTYTFPGSSTATTPITFKFKTTLPDAYYKNATEQTIKNTAGMKVPGRQEATDEGQVVIEPWAIKEGNLVAGTSINDSVVLDSPTGGTRYIRWEIDINEAGRTLGDVTVTDVLPTDGSNTTDATTLKFSKATWYRWNGSAWTEEPGSTTTTALANYTLSSVTTPVKLVIWQEVVRDGGLVATQDTYKNKATVAWANTPAGSVTTNEKGVTIGYNASSKSGLLNLTDRKVAWTITVDLKGQSPDGLVIYDLIVNGDTFNFGAITGYDGFNGETFGSIKDRLVSSAKYQQKMDDTFVPSDNMKKYTLTDVNGNTAELLVMTGLTSTVSTFKFTTDVLDPTVFAPDTGTITEAGQAKSVLNTALLYNGTDFVAQMPATVNYKIRLLDKDMLDRAETAKATPTDINPNNRATDAAAGFNYKDRTVIFRFSVNPKGVDWSKDENKGNFTLTDLLPQGWSFVGLTDGENAPKFAVYQGTTLGTGEGDNETPLKLLPAQTPLLSDPASKGIQAIFSQEGGNQKVTFTFQNLNDSYVILVKAQLSEAAYRAYLTNGAPADTDPVYEVITNTAVLTRDGVTGLEFKGEQDIKIKDDILTKDYTPNLTEGYLTWWVEYKPYEVAMPGNMLVDQLPIGLDVRIDSTGKLIINGNIKAYRMTLNADGTYSKVDISSELKPGPAGADDVSVSYNNEDRELTFKFPASGEDGPGYRFEYITDITGETSAQDITNTVSLQAGGVEQTNTGKPFRITREAGWANFDTTGWVRIHKVDEIGNPLGGAEFKVFTLDGIVLREGITADDNGELILRHLPVDGTYMLKETKAPISAAYILDARSYEIKVDGQGNTTINGVSNATPLEVYNYLSETQGNLAITKQVAGNGDRNKDFAFTVELMLPGGQGERVPFEGQLLSSINGGTPAFLMFNSDGIATFTLKHGQTITITGIPMDTVYTVTEDSYAQQGYVTSPSTPPTGTIAAGVTSSVTVTNTIPVSNFGTLVRIHKVDAATGKSLAGAEFTLYGASGTALQTVTTNADGYAWFTQVPDGNYTIRETKAPVGYYAAQGALALKAEGSFVEYTVKNSLGDSRVPVTGDETGVLGFALMGAALLLGLALVKKRRDA